MSARLNVFGDTSDACAAVVKKDNALRVALDAIGAPYIRRRPGGFEALFRIIVEQQVSVPSAQAIWARCGDRFKEMTPAEALRQGKDGLRACGLSGPKIRYVLALAENMEMAQQREEVICANFSVCIGIKTAKLKVFAFHPSLHPHWPSNRSQP